MRKTWCALILAMLAGAGAVPWAMGAEETAVAPPAAVPEMKKPVVQIAILLDTSGSMNGLIGQAKTQLWKVVNEFAKANRGGMRPEIEVALYHYGTPSLGKETGYIKQLVPLSTDLDKVSEELFKLKTSGGDEYCGQVIQTATRDLKWSDDKSAYKAIFIAGNEPFTQGTIKYEDACKEAIARGIIVNTIFCGNEKEGISGHWKDGAVMADGSYMAINQNKAVVAVVAPQDKEIAELSAKINKTYIAYGTAGEAGAARQAAEDAHAAALAPAVAAERGAAKGGAAYRNEGWDLVDAVQQNKVNLKDVKDAELPEAMKNLDEKGREAYVQEKIKERADIQAQIQKLSAERTQFLAEKAREPSGDKTLDAAIIETVHSQANRANMTFEAPK